MRHVSKPCQIRALLEPRLGPIVQGIERAEEAEQRQPGRAQVLPLHEGCQGRPGRRQVRSRLLQLRDRAGGSKPQAESGDAGHVSGHRQTGAREEVVRDGIRRNEMIRIYLRQVSNRQDFSNNYIISRNSRDNRARCFRACAPVSKWHSTCNGV